MKKNYNSLDLPNCECGSENWNFRGEYHIEDVWYEIYVCDNCGIEVERKEGWNKCEHGTLLSEHCPECL